MSEPEAIVEFWLKEVGPDGWYSGGEDIDAEIRGRYLTTWEAANAGAREFWLNGPRGALAYLILTDQFPRNMFRGDPRSYATDARARAASDLAIAKGWDMAIPEPERQFFYMPWMHSEEIIDQDRGIALFEAKMPQGRDHHLLHARAHREIIQRFGRFPYRNAPLGRVTTDEEAAFLEGGSYMSVVRALQNKG